MHPRQAARLRRHRRLRKKVSGTNECPRLCVFRSNRHIYAQVIDDIDGRTLVAASTRDDAVADGKSADAAASLGAVVAERAKAAGIESVIFDRGGYRYHGRVKVLADAARDAGLKF